jgi:hypothetical protein
MSGTEMMNLTMVLQKVDGRKNTDHILFFDTPDKSMVMVKGFNRYEQYKTRLTGREMLILTTLCEWCENGDAWVLKLNATLPQSLKKWMF